MFTSIQLISRSSLSTAVVSSLDFDRALLVKVQATAGYATRGGYNPCFSTSNQIWHEATIHRCKLPWTRCSVEAFHNVQNPVEQSYAIAHLELSTRVSGQSFLYVLRHSDFITQTRWIYACKASFSSLSYPSRDE